MSCTGYHHATVAVAVAVAAEAAAMAAARAMVALQWHPRPLPAATRATEDPVQSPVTTALVATTAVVEQLAEGPASLAALSRAPPRRHGRLPLAVAAARGGGVVLSQCHTTLHVSPKHELGCFRSPGQWKICVLCRLQRLQDSCLGLLPLQTAQSLVHRATHQLGVAATCRHPTYRATVGHSPLASHPAGGVALSRVGWPRRW